MTLLLVAWLALPAVLAVGLPRLRNRYKEMQT